MLWFTWLQVTLFDIRFGSDSVFERVCKALQFGVMAGFAVVGPGYKIGWAPDDKEAPQAVRSFQTLSLILMISRLILAGQYAVVFWCLRGYRKVILPMFLHIVVLFAAAMVYMGLFFAFSIESGEQSLRAWYFCIGIETALILLVSGRYRFLSIRRTCIHERLGLLTLVVLGEGILGLCNAEMRIIGSDLRFGADSVASVACGVLTIYALWMLYFDQVEKERVGTIRQQVWVMVHFPYHVAILLVVEGISQLCVWRKLTDLVGFLSDKISAMGQFSGDADMGDQLGTVMEEFFKPFEENSGHHKVAKPNITSELLELTEASESNTTKALELVQSIMAKGVTFAAESFGIEPPEKSKEAAESEVEVMNSLTAETFTTIFVYFFMAAGLTLIITSALFLLGKRHKIRADYINLVVRTLVGIGLSLLVIMGLSDNERVAQAGATFAWSAWVLPTVAIAFAFGECPDPPMTK